MQFVLRLVIALMLVVSVSWLGLVTPAVAQGQQTFTAEELSRYDGQDGRPAYYAYEGLVYDVTGSRLWREGQHFGLQAGQDLTGKMDGAPHGTEVFSGFEVMGRYVEAEAAPVAPAATTPVVDPAPDSQAQAAPVAPDASERKWYEGRIRIAGLSILGWTGILLGIAFVGNFATCFVLPWTKLPLPWHGSRPGPDPLDGAKSRPHWGNVHKYFAWGTVFFGILHGVIGLMQMLGYYL